MGLLENLNAPLRRTGKTRCKMAVVIDKLKPEEQEKVNEILRSLFFNEGEYSSNWLALTLTKDGHPVNHQTVLRHARSECCCES